MYNLCHNEDEYCRLHAAHCMGEIALHGDMHAVAALVVAARDARCHQSVSASEAAQCTAIEALGKVAPRGDEGAIATLTMCMVQVACTRIRAAAFQALSKVDPLFNKDLAIEELLQFLEDKDEHA